MFQNCKLKPLFLLYFAFESVLKYLFILIHLSQDVIFHFLLSFMLLQFLTLFNALHPQLLTLLNFVFSSLLEILCSNVFYDTALSWIFFYILRLPLFLFSPSSSFSSSSKIALLLLLSCFSRVRLCATHRQQPTRLPVPGILQARTLEWVAISFSSA